MTKATNKRAIRALPALRTSLLWFKRETVRQIERRAQEVASPRLQAWLTAKARKVRATELADLRQAYQAERVNEIAVARRFELSRAVPGIAWLRAEMTTNTSTETKRLRLQRLIGLDDTKGVRGDLARARAAAAAGFTTAGNGKPVGEAIASLEAALETYHTMLADLR